MSTTSSPRGNLTGSARTLNDTVVIFYNTIQKWKSALLDGVKLLQAVHEHLEDGNIVEESCEKIGQVVLTMKNHVMSLKECEKKMYNLYLLNKEAVSPCLSWSFLTVAQSIQKISTTYSAETDFREKIVSSLQTRNSKEMDVINVFWLHCGQVSSDIEALLEALLRECMLKT